MDLQEAKSYLASLLNKNLRVTSTDQRIFHGQFKCTDPDQNVILANTYEYRQPSLQQLQESASKAVPGQTAVSANMASRYMGLVVVPGRHIVRVEVEEFASQMRPAPAPPALGEAGAGAGVGAERGRLEEEGDAALHARRGSE